MTQNTNVPKETRRSTQPGNPILNLRDQIDRIFDGALRGWPMHGPSDRPMADFFGGTNWQGASLSPDIDISEDDNGYRISAELPGLAQDQIEVSLKENVLTLKGEKEDERDEKKDDYYKKERRYGRFSVLSHCRVT